MELKINLIPVYRKEEIKRSRRWKLVLRLGVALFFMAVVFFAVLSSFSYALRFNLQTVSGDSKDDVDHDRRKLIIDYDRRFENINRQISDIVVLKNSQLYWSKLLENVSREIVSGVKIENLSTKNYAVFITGEADNRDSLISFKERLEKNSCFIEVGLPLSNLVSKENITFQMDLKIREECVHARDN